MTEDEKLFNEWHKKLRARIEEWFAYVDRHRFLHYCPRKHHTCALMWHFIWNAECLQDIASPPAYTDVFCAIPTVHRGFITPCNCGFKDPSLIPSFEYRQRLLSHVVAATGGKYPVTKNSAHRARSSPQYKDIALQAQKRKEKESEKRVEREKALSKRQAVSAAKGRTKK